MSLDQKPLKDDSPFRTTDEQRSIATRHDIECISGWELVGVMTCLTVVCFLMLLDVSIFVTAIPRITTDFHSLIDIGWYSSAYNLCSAALQPLSGKFYTHFHAKSTFLVFFLVFEIGSLISGLAVSSAMFIVGRAIAGIGTSGIQNGAFTIVAASIPLNKRPVALGIIMGICQVGLVSGPLIGGALTEYSTWRWCFLINLPIGAVCAAIILIVKIPDHRSQQGEAPERFRISQLDLAGFCLFIPFAVLFFLAFQVGGSKFPWNSATVIGLLCGGGSAFMVFVIWEYRVGNQAMIPLFLIKRRVVWTSCLCAMFLFATMLGTSYYLAIYFQSVRGMTPFNSGVSTLPVIISQLIGSALSGVLVQKIGYYLPVMLAGAVVTVIGNYLLSTLSLESSTPKWAGYQVILGLGRGVGIQMPIIALQADCQPVLTPLATSTLLFFQTLGGSVFISAATSVFNSKLRSELLTRVPELDVDKIIHAGAAGVGKVVPSESISKVLIAYVKGVSAVFHLLIAMSACLCLTSLGIGWTDIRNSSNVHDVGVDF
ncbi:major facilitator superfamily domain-containing protein [Mariannaea sp. PMI_226]|nr:major facilitator superfamily domain-containing protein [Mariannaea sp. PMI_226]